MWHSSVPITDDLRQKFAVEYLRLNKDHYKAGASIWPADPNRGVTLGMELIADPITRDIIDNMLKSKGARYFLPTKEEAAAEIWSFASDKSAVRDTKDRLQAYRLFCDIMGYIEKANINVNNGVVNNKVMIVENHGTDAEWEDTLVQQQRKLIADAA